MSDYENKPFDMENQPAKQPENSSETKSNVLNFITGSHEQRGKGEVCTALRNNGAKARSNQPAIDDLAGFSSGSE